MPWAAGAVHAGFSGSTPWLPVAAGHAELAVDRQRDDPGSHWHCTRAALRWRREHPAMRWGDFQCLHADADVLVAQRTATGDRVLLAFNLGATPRELSLPAGLPAWGEPLALHQACLHQGRLHLPPRSALWLAAC
jgi:alpha-glucosidase